MLTFVLTISTILSGVLQWARCGGLRIKGQKVAIFKQRRIIGARDTQITPKRQLSATSSAFLQKTFLTKKIKIHTNCRL